MRSGLLLALITLGVITGVAVADENIEKRSFKVDRVRNANFAGRNGPKELLKTYRKHRLSVPAGLVAAAAAAEAKLNSNTDRHRPHHPHHRRPMPTEPLTPSSSKEFGATSTAAPATSKSSSSFSSPTGVVAAVPEINDVEYLAVVQIGGQVITLDFDTGSSDLWVFSTQMTAAQQEGHTVFDPFKSSTFDLIPDASFSISYGDGSGAEGIVGTDTVTIGGVSFANQAVELATAVSPAFVEDINSDGLLGLAFSSINTVRPNQQRTFFKDQLAEPVFTADLRPQEAGAYEFGRVDKSKFAGDMTWIPINTTMGFWQFSSETFSVNGGDVQQGTSAAQAIADTGTTLMVADPVLVKAYYAQVENSQESAEDGGFIFPCDATLPDLTVDIGGMYQAKVKGSDINFAKVGDGRESSRVESTFCWMCVCSCVC